jgi:hypothetical protein
MGEVDRQPTRAWMKSRVEEEAVRNGRAQLTKAAGGVPRRLRFRRIVAWALIQAFAIAERFYEQQQPGRDLGWGRGLELFGEQLRAG